MEHLELQKHYKGDWVARHTVTILRVGNQKKDFLFDTIKEFLRSCVLGYVNNSIAMTAQSLHCQVSHKHSLKLALCYHISE